MISLLSLLLAAPSIELRASVDGGPAARGWVYAHVGQKVELVAVTGGKPKSIRWFTVEATTPSLDNTSPSFHFETVSYARDEVERCRDAVRCLADVTPRHLPRAQVLAGLGTMAFQVEAVLEGGVTVSTPGVEAKVSGGLSREVMRVTFRRDDTLIGYATELVNTPYIFGSAGVDGKNQSDLLIGSDCADLVIYARRRMGKKASYASSYGIEQQALPLKTGQAVREGDVLHFPNSRHVGLLFRDNEPKGVLDDSDLLLHTCWAPPTVQPLGETSCANGVRRALRFPE